MSTRQVFVHSELGPLSDCWHPKQMVKIKKSKSQLAFLNVISDNRINSNQNEIWLKANTRRENDSEQFLFKGGTHLWIYI